MIKRPALKQMWLITFSDLMTLILCFFVMLFAMSTPKTNAYFKTAVGFENVPTLAPQILLQHSGVDLNYLMQILSQKNALPKVHFVSEDKITLNFDEKENLENLSRLIQILNNITNQTQIHLFSTDFEAGALESMRFSNLMKEQGLQALIPLVVQKSATKKPIQIIIFQKERKTDNAY